MIETRASTNQKAHVSCKKFYDHFLRITPAEKKFCSLFLIFLYIVNNTIIFLQSCLTPFILLTILKNAFQIIKKIATYVNEPLIYWKLFNLGLSDVVHIFLYVWLLKWKSHGITDRTWTLDSNGGGFNSQLFHLPAMLLEHVN